MRKALTTALMLFGAVTATAADAPMEEVIVHGEYAGPGMWKVTSADHPDHVLWIVGEPTPMSKRLSWRSKQVERVLLQSQEVLLQAGIVLKADEDILMDRPISSITAIRNGEANPDQGMLEDHVTEASYARWLVQKKRYLGHDDSVEKLRPILAAERLRYAAFKKLRLRDSAMIWDVLSKIAYQHGIPVNAPKLVFTFPADEVHAKVKQLEKDEIADADCFDKTLELTEALGNRAVEEQRARAWATGDVEKLMSLPGLPGYSWPCQSAFMKAQSVSEYVPEDVGEKVTVLWVDTAGELLGKNESTLSVVSLSWLLQPNGLLERLRNRGYAIQPPE
jgi:hypothetical protein